MGAIDFHLTLRIPGYSTTSFPVTDALGEEIARVLTRYYGIDEPVRFLSGSASTARPAPRVSIRPGKYRNPFSMEGEKQGFVVRSSYGASIFTETRSSAEKIRARLHAGENTRMSDFLP